MKRTMLVCWMILALSFLTGATQQPAVRQVVNGTGLSSGYYAATGSVISPSTGHTLDATTVLTRKDSVTIVSANTTLGAHNVVFATIGAGGITLTLPAASSTTVGSYRLIIADTGVGNLTLAPNGSDKINGVNSSVTKTGQYNGYEALWISASDGWYVRALSTTVGGSGTVTSIATTSPITGGTITGSGTIACATCAVTGSTLAQFAATTSAQLLGVLTNPTGTGLSVFNNTPTLIAPLLGTPTSGVLTNTTGLPISTGVSGLGTGVATFLATPSSANLAAVVTDETGTLKSVFSDAPTFTTTITTPSVTFTAGQAFTTSGDTLKLARGTNAQLTNIYNTTSGADSEFLQLGWVANIATIQTNISGTGTQRGLRIGTVGATNLQFFANNSDVGALLSTGHLVTNNDNANDIGTSGALRPRTIYTGTSIIHGAIAFASLGTPANGTMIYCNNCDQPTLVATTCTSSGGQTGALAIRLNGVWKCLA